MSPAPRLPSVQGKNPWRPGTRSAAFDRKLANWQSEQAGRCEDLARRATPSPRWSCQSHLTAEGRMRYHQLGCSESGSRRRWPTRWLLLWGHAIRRLDTPPPACSPIARANRTCGISSPVSDVPGTTRKPVGAEFASRFSPEARGRPGSACGHVEASTRRDPDSAERALESRARLEWGDRSAVTPTVGKCTTPSLIWPFPRGRNPGRDTDDLPLEIFVTCSFRLYIAGVGSCGDRSEALCGSLPQLCWRSGSWALLRRHRYDARPLPPAERSDRAHCGGTGSARRGGPYQPCPGPRL